jgi:hypothetical protein
VRRLDRRDGGCTPGDPFPLDAAGLAAMPKVAKAETSSNG